MNLSRGLIALIAIAVIAGISAGTVAANPSLLSKGLYLAQDVRADMPALFVTGDYTVENFEPSYSVVNSTGYTVYIEENLSSVSSNSSILDIETTYEDKYSRLSGIMFQFGDPDLDGGPNQDWNPSLDPRTRNAIEEYDYIKYDGYYYNLSYEGPEELPGREVSFDARLLDDRVTPGDPAKMELEFKVNADENVSIGAGAPYPFQTLTAVSEDSRICVWSREYKKSEHVGDGLCNGGEGLVNLLKIRKEYPPGETIKRNYSIRARNIDQPGEYVIEEDVDYITASDSKTLNYRVSFELKSN